MYKPIRKAVLPVAGLGTRFLPATKAIPKEMLTVVDRPILQHVVDEARAAGQHFDVGLRINPLCPCGEVPRYDPSSPGSRLGFPIDQLTPEIMEQVDGIHFHNLCEQDFEPLRRTWDTVFDAIEPWFGQLKWINMGGGHHITRADYQREELVEFLKDAKDDTIAEIYLEPGEAVALDAGILVGGDIGGIDRAERQLEGEAAGKGLAARRVMAGGAIGGTGEIFTMRDQRRR